MTIFDVVKASEISLFWEAQTVDRVPYLGETLLPNKKKLGLSLNWLKGASGLPVVLKPSAFDSKAVPRARLGFDKLSAEMPFFKESAYIDEEQRQELNMVLETGNAAYIEAVVGRIFADSVALVEGAAARREQMRMMMLTTGLISIEANGQKYDFDYSVPSANKVTATTSWSTTTADIFSMLRGWMDSVEDATGVRPARALCSRKTWGYILANAGIRNAVWGNNSAAPITDAKAKQILLDELSLEVYVYAKRYKGDAGTAAKYVPDDTFVMFPSGELGNGWFGTTPEESDLRSNKSMNVAVVDTGVAITTIQHADPVNVETKVTMVYLPDFPTADQIIIADVIA